MKKDYYKILNVNKTFSEDELKKAYKKACLKYHPDRLAGKSDKEKAEAEEKFKDVQEAYECLSDPDKKAHYDRFGSMDGYGQGWSAGADMFSHFSSFFDDFGFPGFGNMFGNSNKTKKVVEQGANLRIQIGINISEILNGGEKEISYSRDVRCKDCHGTGGEGVETCRHCNGTGMITVVKQGGFGIISHSTPCNYCNGTGQTIKNKCKSCNGEGLVKETNIVKINIPKGCKNGHTIVITGGGCESKTEGAQNGDLQVILLHKYDTSKYLIQGNIIYEKLDVPYYKAILGETLYLSLENGKKVHLNIPAGTQDEDNLYGTTVNGYEYRYIINVTTPKSVSKKEGKLLEEIRNIYKQ